MTVADALADRKLVVVSNREPYVHDYEDDEPIVSRPVGGLVAALDSVVADVGGTWVAWGSGDADFDPRVAPEGRVQLPPESAQVSDEAAPGYTLSRIDLPRRLVENYYYGYSNQVLWPLCHLEAHHVRVDPAFMPAYREANRLFADRVVEAGPDIVWFQDYHLALAPGHVRDARPDARLVQFWHIPWPTPEFFEICPHAAELLHGLLANDAVGFHLDRYAGNFLDCVDAFVPEAEPNREDGTVSYDGRTAAVFTSPIGVDTVRIADAASTDAAAHYWDRVTNRYDIEADQAVVLGVDRLDYTKGILERLDAIDHLLETTPELAEEFTFLQKGTRTREHIPAYRRYYDDVRARIAELDHVHGTSGWTPAIYIEEDADNRELAGLYRNADVAVVSSRRDGMNLVAKEFVAASAGAVPGNGAVEDADTVGSVTTDGITSNGGSRAGVPGALVVSQFVGAAESLCPAALSVNPYDVAGFADTLREALVMTDAERRERMATMSTEVREKDIDAWLDTQLDALIGE
ncbi:MAG: trehalose-6-phosphate synthase [Halolamina sp.]|uniref:alpha,alpha-trehalose-phosphate synthase (UDP-forming) n=1 Tax=Halolamina sp. TaxID=1940283 RepID=UPI002FC2C075